MPVRELNKSTSGVYLRLAVEKLNQNSNTDLIFRNEQGVTFTICGGAGNYVVSIRWADERELNLCGPDRESDELIEFVAADQLGAFWKWQVADLESTVQALQYFAKTGEPDPSLEWFKT